MLAALCALPHEPAMAAQQLKQAGSSSPSLLPSLAEEQDTFWS